MPSTRGSSFVTETVASRMKRNMRPAAVDAIRRMDEMAADAYPEDMSESYRSAAAPSASSSAAPVSGMRTAVASHRYALRSMRR
jgi:hypothetical protein